MRLHTAIILVLTVIAQIPRDCNCDSSIQNADDSRVASTQGWESSDPEPYREEYEGEPEMNKRVRNRGTKRRRRLRPRTRTTERPHDAEILDELHTAASSLEGTENEEVAPRRRPTGKRRRRPLRRYQDSDQPITRPRRRKGGRKRIRPPVINAENIETTTFISADTEAPATNKYTPGEVNIEKTTTPYDKYYKNDNTRFSNMEIPNYKSYEMQDNNSTPPMKEVTQYPEDKENDNKEDTNELVVPQREEKIIINENNSENEFGNKLFDRKTLFSSSRKLPETSATLRRRLTPRIKHLSKNFTFDNHARIIKPLANLESELESNNKMKNEVITQPGFTELPEPIEPYKIINKMNSESSKDQNLEEPNYPKLELFLKRNKTIFREETKEVTTPYPVTTTVINVEMTTLEEQLEEVKSTVQTSINKNNSIPQVQIDDEVFDLLKSETGNNRLKRILESRNMTLSQLLDHRERGSSKFHLSDIFSKTQPKSKEDDKPIETEINITELTDSKHEDTPAKFLPVSNPTSPPSFVTENNLIQNREQQEQPQELHNFEEERPVVTTQYRESRIFDSLPEFTSTKASIPELRPYPTWRIIPNPKLKPVSIRGDYKEIQISNVLTTHKPYLGSDIDKIFLLEDRDNFIHHRNKIAATINSESHESTFLFRKIPVSVKSAIVISGAILVLAIFGFLSVLVSCRLRQKKARLRAKQDILCEHLQNDDFMASQQSLSPVLSKHNRGPVFSQGVHSNAASNRHYYLWRTLRKTFQYD